MEAGMISAWWLLPAFFGGAFSLGCFLVFGAEDEDIDAVKDARSAVRVSREFMDRVDPESVRAFCHLAWIAFVCRLMGGKGK
jgi:hypothetical protein